MNEIKFRYVYKNNNGSISIRIISLEDFEHGFGFQVGEGEIISRDRYSGFKDKNGIEIYDKDFCKFTYGVGYVFWCDDTAKFKIEFDIDTDDLWHYLIGREKEEFEVIGNVHLNPEFKVKR